MNPICGRCDRVVYPTEKVTCLDKNWHKGCFTCEVCNLTLNMKTYKGFNKLPYCSAHYPKTKFTSVADTPENLRLKQQSKNQSQVHYHKDFEKSKGKYTAVPDDPETLRIRNMTETISNVKYHAEHERPGREASHRHMRDPSDAAHQPSERSHNYNYEYAPEPAAASPPSSGTSEHSQNYHYEPAPEPVRPAAAASTTSSGKRFRAVYDYTAADDDEVSFMDGDVIIEVERIDAGWMYGRVERTGQQGMLPANYIEAI